MKIKSNRSNSAASINYTHKSSVRSTPETNACYAIDLTLNSSGTHLAALTVPTTIQLFDAARLERISELSSTSNNFDMNDPSAMVKISSIRFASVSPHLIFTATNQNSVLGWDIRTPQQESLQLNGCADKHKFLSVSCNNEDLLIAAGSELKDEENVSIAFWDVRTPSTNQLLGYYTESHSDDIINLEFSRLCSTRLLSGSTDGLVCLYDITQPAEDDALEQVYNAGGPISKCGYSQRDTIYAITASNDFFIWSSKSEDQQLLVKGDTNLDETTKNSESTSIGTSTTSSTPIHHLPSTHATIIDLLGTSNLKDILPKDFQDYSSCHWPLFLCDHTGKISIALVGEDQNDQPTIIQLQSPHSEPIRAVNAYQSTLYTCGEDGKIVRWQNALSVENKFNGHSSKSKRYFNNRRPY